MNKHTPGPWARQDTEIIATQFGECIAIAQYPGHGPKEEAEGIANATLIAAAPDLLAACQSMLECCGPAEGWNGETNKSLLLIEAAIAKALGTAPAAPATVDRQQMLADILCTAFEGGIGYWCLADHATKDAKGNYLSLVDCEDAEDPSTKFGTITLNTIQLGIHRILSGAVQVRPDIRADIERSWVSNEGDCDADAADCIVQAGLFNEIIYG